MIRSGHTSFTLIVENVTISWYTFLFGEPLERNAKVTRSHGRIGLNR